MTVPLCAGSVWMLNIDCSKAWRGKSLGNCEKH